MDNASKAIIMAGATLIALAIISVGMYFYKSYQQYEETKVENMHSEEVDSYNRFYINSYYSINGTYNTSGALIYGIDVLNIINRIEDDKLMGTSVYDVSYNSGKIPKIVAIRNHIKSDPDDYILSKEELTELRRTYRYKYVLHPGTGYVYKVEFN